LKQNALPRPSVNHRGIYKRVVILERDGGAEVWCVGAQPSHFDSVRAL